MRYMLAMRYGEAEFDGLTASDEEFRETVAFMNGLNDRLGAAGELVDAQGLGLPKQARTVRYVNDEPVVTDGPFGEAKEVLAGYWIVDCTAERAEQMAAEIVEFTRDAIEVREVMSEPPDLSSETQ